MAFRYERGQRTGLPELVIDGWENGIADSPYFGIASMKNANNRFLPGAIYSNYKRILNSTTAGSGVFTADPGTDIITTTVTPFNIGDAFTVSNSGGALPGGLAPNTIYYKANVSNQISASYSAAGGAGAIVNITDAGSGTNTLTTLPPARATFWTQNPASNIYYIQDINGRVWESAGATSYWTLLTGNEAHLAGNGNGIVVYKGYLFNFHGTVVDYCGNGSASGIVAANWGFDWQTGLTGGHMALWGQDDIMYFCNGNSVASVAEVGLGSFNPGNGSTYNYNPAALRLPSYEQNCSWLAELQVNLIIAAGKKLYPWDRTSTSFGIPLFIKESINKVINIMNLLYVTAGKKGNIYISNGYSISPFKKIPDSFFGIIDPQISWGDLMGHRNKLYVGACQSFPSGGIAGVFSIDINTRELNFENQSSHGLTTTGNQSGAPNVLIDLDDSTIDQYASAWYSGTAAGMDTNNTDLYSNGEVMAESDLIPVGTFLDQKTFSNVEYKLDQPAHTGDSITLYWRSSFTGAYNLIGTATVGAGDIGLNTLSYAFTPIEVENIQWFQVKAALSSAASGQYVRLREMRIR